MKRAVIGFVIACGVGLVLTRVAVAADAPATPTVAHVQAATELLQLMDVEKTMMGGASAMADAMIAQEASLAPFRDVLLAWAAKYMTWEVFGPRFVAMYAESFTEQELRDLIAFYRTPSGKKALTLVPQLTQQGAQLGSAVAAEHSKELEEMIKARAAELEKAGAAKP